MDWLTQVYHDTLQSLVAALALLNGLFAEAETWVSHQLTEEGIPLAIQPFLLIALWVLLMIAILRMTTGMARLLVALFLTLLLLHFLRPLLGI